MGASAPPTDRLLVARTSARAMSCTVTVTATIEAGTADDGATLVHRAATRLGELEARWSRFLPMSEVTTLNHAAGTPCHVSDDTVRLIQAAIQAWRATSGAYDPTLLGTIVGLGYAASRDSAAMTTQLAQGVEPIGQPGEVLVDADAGIVRLPVGTAIDPGGIGKGLAADIVVEELMANGAAGALVEIGGDIRVHGRPPMGSAWPIAIDGRDDIVDVDDGGIATSTPLRRTWSQNGNPRHHLIDPSTLRPSAVDVTSCTVIAGTAAWAEAFTKMPFVVGVDDAIRHFERMGFAGSISTSNGVATTANWAEFLR